MKSAEISRKRQEYAAILTIKKPGAMTEKERGKIAMWLHLQAEQLAKDGNGYNDTGDWRARYMG